MTTKIKNYKKHIFEEFCFVVVGHFSILTSNFSSFIYSSWIPSHKSARRWDVFFMATHFRPIVWKWYRCAHLFKECFVLPELHSLK